MAQTARTSGPHEIRSCVTTGYREAIRIFVDEVTPQMFELLEGLYEAPAPAELDGALVSVTG